MTDELRIQLAAFESLQINTRDADPLALTLMTWGTSDYNRLVNKPTINGTEIVGALSAIYTPTGTVSQPTFYGDQGSVSVNGTPTGAISVGTGTANYTPAGTVSAPNISVELNTVSKYVASSATGGGSVTAGTAASCTLPVLTTSVDDEVLTIGWTAGSFTANTPTSVTLPSFSSQTIATGVYRQSATQPTFTGTGVQLAFTGNALTSTGNFTPAGTISQPTFTGTSGTVIVR